MKDIAVIVVLVLFLGFPAFVVWQSSKHVNWWADRYEFANERHEYYFDGANSRGYLDICPNQDGEVGVWYADECTN